MKILENEKEYARIMWTRADGVTVEVAINKRDPFRRAVIFNGDELSTDPIYNEICIECAIDALRSEEDGNYITNNKSNSTNNGTFYSH